MTFLIRDRKHATLLTEPVLQAAIVSITERLVDLTVIWA